jgi:hypothetical protein
MGLDFDYGGEIHPALLTKRICQMEPKLATKETRTEGNWIVCGMDEEGVKRRTDALLKVSLEAERRGEMVFWG